jgi:hypothetical protein
MALPPTPARTASVAALAAPAETSIGAVMTAPLQSAGGCGGPGRAKSLLFQELPGGAGFARETGNSLDQAHARPTSGKLQALACKLTRSAVE